LWLGALPYFAVWVWQRGWNNSSELGEIGSRGSGSGSRGGESVQNLQFWQSSFE